MPPLLWVAWRPDNAELQAVLQDIEAIRPSTIAFENALNEPQKKQLAKVMGAETPTRGQPAGEIAAQSLLDNGEHRSGTNIGAREQRSDRVRWPWLGFAF